MFNSNIFEVAIYHVGSGVKADQYHLVLVDTNNSNNSQVITSAETPEKLYQKAFEVAHTAHKKNVLVAAMKKREVFQEQEELALGLGQAYRNRGDQQNATDHFRKANQFFKQRVELETEILDIFGVKISQNSFVNPVQLY
jgi:hypothetical protein